MTPRVIEARYIKDYVLHIRFADGQEGDVDLGSELHGEIFEPLRDPAFFAQFQVHDGLGTIAWPNGADFAPEFLYALVRVPA
ncbi:MAG: DUF2442 domain-containing protein [Terriglobia bacterium]|jgi:hypothetical protein